MADIKLFSAIAPKVWKLATELEKDCGIVVEQVKYVQYSNNGAQILAYLDERGSAIERVLRGLEAVADRFGVEMQVTEPYRTDTQPSGRGVRVTAATAFDGLPLVFKLLLDAEQYEHALAVKQLTGVAA